MHRPARTAPVYDAGAVTRLVRSQSGVVSRAQLLALDVSGEDIKRFLRQRLLFRVERGMYVNHHGQLTPTERAWWACLRHSGSVLADESALELARDGSGGRLSLPLQLALSSGSNPSAVPGVRFHRVAALGTIAVAPMPAALPRMLPAHAALRVASRAADDNAVVARLAEAVNWRVTTPAMLLTALDKHPSLRRRAFLREVIADLAVGACSVLEREYLRRVERAHGLPRGVRQQPRRTPEGMEFRDVDYPAFGLVVELQGRAFHSGKQAWDNDLERELDDLIAARHTVGLGWRQVLGTPCRTAGKVGTLLGQRGWVDGPHRCGALCDLYL